MGPFVLLTLLGAHPPEPGVEVSTSVGVGRWSYPTGCGSRAQVLEAPVDLRVRAVDAKGWTLHVQQEVAPGRVVPGSEETRENVLSTTSIARVGLNSRHVGFEVGPAMLIRPHFEQPIFVPSAVLRVGAPDIIYGHVGMFAEPTNGGISHGMFELGVGHSSEQWRGELAVLPFASRGWFELPVGRGVWLGAEGRIAPGPEAQPQAEWRGALRLTLGPEAWR